MESKVGSLAGRVAVVTGASSGIGRAIALALSRQGVQLCLVGRNPKTLAETLTASQQFAEAASFEIDLRVEETLKPLALHLERKVGKLDILVHCAGVIYQAPMADALIEDFDVQYATNVRGPYLLTQRLLPWLTTTRGQVVFINSSVGLTATRPDVGQYSATKHALKAVADSLRHEVNPKGIRVLSVYLGRTATPMQKALFQKEGRAYNSKVLLQPDDVASVVVQILMLPRTAEVTDISIRPMLKT
ncbi:MAG: SDR family NAD(P)-dependent oxidoreductase [Acidobacteriia bacterium]|nr:SDR family NAD(P)-dependent oxidoreductase [Terriglobia bacterium]